MNDREVIARMMDILHNARLKALEPFPGLSDTLTVFGIDVANMHSRTGAVISYYIRTWPGKVWFDLTFYDDFLITDAQWVDHFDMSHIEGVLVDLLRIQTIIRSGYSDQNRLRIEGIINRLPIDPLPRKR